MDMNRKSRFGLKNNNTQLAASLVQKFVLILALCILMATTAHAGAFLSNKDVIDQLLYTIDINTTPYYDVYNRSDDSDDSWSAAPKTDPPYLDYEKLFPDGIGYTGSDYTGFYIGTFKNNTQDTDLSQSDQPSDLEYLIQYFFDFPEIEFSGYAKYDLPGDNPEEWTNDEYGLKVTLDESNYTFNDDDEPITGTWEVTNSEGENETINFYSVNGGKEYALYYIDPAEWQGKWTTAHVDNPSGNQPGISHFSIVSSEVVPEPATMILFGMGLMGLAGIGRRTWQK